MSATSDTPAGRRDELSVTNGDSRRTGPLPSSGPRVVFRTLRNGTWRNDLIKRLIAGDHAESAAGTLFEGLHAILQITYFGRELPIAFAELVVFGPLRRDRCFQTTQLAD